MKKIIPDNAVLIPDGAKCVFKGEIFDVYQWPQKLFDGTDATYEMLKRVDTVQLLCVDEDKIILLDEQQSGRPPFLRLPGGRVEPGEDWLTAAKREGAEEIGMEFTDWRLVMVRQPVIKIEWFVATFLAKNVAKRQAAKPDAGERISVLKLEFNEAKRRLQAEDNPLIDYAKPLFEQAPLLESLLSLPEFEGKEVDR